MQVISACQIPLLVITHRPYETETVPVAKVALGSSVYNTPVSSVLGICWVAFH